MNQIPNIEEILPTENDLEKVGQHYWGGDYEPTYQELINLKQSFKEILTPKIEKFLHHQLQKDRHSLHTSLIEAVEGLKAEPYDERNMFTEEAAAYNQALDDTLTTINSIFKE